MFRFTLVGYLLLLSATGPNLCCCTVLRSVATVMSWAYASEDNDAQTPACCRGRAEDTLNQTPEQSQSAPGPDRNDGPGERCPCESGVQNAVPPLLAAFSLEQSRHWHDGVTADRWFSKFPWAPRVLQVIDPSDQATSAAQSGRQIRIAIRSWNC